MPLEQMDIKTDSQCTYLSQIADNLINSLFWGLSRGINANFCILWYLIG